MKKFLESFFIIVLLVGIVVGINRVNKNEKKPRVENKIPSQTETYVDELCIPLIEVDSLNPLRTRNSQVFQVLGIVYEPLFEYDSEEFFHGVLGESFSKLDAKTWIVKLKRDVRWHDEEIFSALDVIFTIDMLKKYPLVYSANVSNIESVEKLDGSSIKIHLSEDDDFFIHKLTFPIIPEHYFAESMEDDEKAKRPIGTGPFQYDLTMDNGNIILKFNQHWWKNQTAKLQKIYLCPYASYGEAIKGFKSANVDMIVTNMSEWKNKFGTIGLNHYSFENSEFEVIIPNYLHPVLQEISVRRAILQAINRENIINSVYDDNAVISDSGVHTNSYNSISNFEYDIEQAKQLLLNNDWSQDENGWYKEIEGKKYTLSFKLLVNKDDAMKKEVAGKIKDDLKEIGINLTIKEMTLDDIKTAIWKDEFELALVSLDMKGEDDLVQSIKMNSSRNYANYFSHQLEDVIVKIQNDINNNYGVMEEFLNRYKSEVPYIGLYYKTSTILTNKSVKGNFNPSWTNVYRNIETFCK